MKLSLRTEPTPCESVTHSNCNGWRHHLWLETDFDAAWWSVDVELGKAEFLSVGGRDTETLPGRMTLSEDDHVLVAIDETEIQLDATPTVFGCQ